MAFRLSSLRKWLDWNQSLALLRRLPGWIKEQFTPKSVIGAVLFIWAFIPDTAGRLSYWQGLYRDFAPVFSKVYAFALTGGGRFIMMVVGLGIIWLDHRRVVSQRQQAVSTPAAQPTQIKSPTQSSEPHPYRNTMKVENCWVEQCHFELEDPFEPLVGPGATHEVMVVDFLNDHYQAKMVIGLVAKITYYDGKNRPYYSTAPAIWTDASRTQSLDCGRSAKLIIALSNSDGRCFALTEDKDNVPNIREVDLRKGDGFVLVRLTYSCVGFVDNTQQFYFSARLTKRMSIDRVPLSLLEAS
jgi:hypothetical protein